MEEAGKYKDIADREPEEAEEFRSNFITLEFREYPELRDWLHDQAKEQVRDVASQIMWICKQAMDIELKQGAYRERIEVM
jgi:hypothetical protein